MGGSCAVCLVVSFTSARTVPHYLFSETQH
jgi:hypothetical protein